MPNAIVSLAQALRILYIYRVAPSIREWESHYITQSPKQLVRRGHQRVAAGRGFVDPSDQRARPLLRHLGLQVSRLPARQEDGLRGRPEEAHVLHKRRRLRLIPRRAHGDQVPAAPHPQPGEYIIFRFDI